MFEARDESKLNFFSSFLGLIGAFAASFVLFYLFVSQEEIIYNFFREYKFEVAVMLLDLITIIIVFLIFNTSFYSLISYQRTRMLILSVVFLSVGCLQLLYIIYGYSGGDATIDPEKAELLYGTFSRLFMSAGILASSIIPYDMQSGSSNSVFVKVVPFLGMTLFIFFNRWTQGYIMGMDPNTNLSMLKLFLEYLVAAAYVVATISYLKQYLEKRNRFLLHGAAGIMIIAFGQGVKMVYGMPHELSFLVFSLYQTVGLIIFFIAMFRNNIDIPIAQLVNAEKQIKLYAENLEKIVERRTSEIRQVNARFIKEMDYARSIQQSLLPLKRLNFKKLTFYSEYFPCERLSGDFYDIYRIDDENVGMYVLDVSGHGISAALMTMFCNNYIKSTERLIKRYRGLKPHRNLKHFYEEFNKMNFPEEMHMVIFFASYNLINQTLTYSSGGMNCFPILMRANGEAEYLDKSVGFPICRLSDFFDPEYTSVKIQLHDGDRVLFYTDGLVDKEKNSMLDQDELISLMKEYVDQPVKNLNKELSARIRQFSNVLDDDVTYFIMDIGAQ